MGEVRGEESRVRKPFLDDLSCRNLTVEKVTNKTNEPFVEGNDIKMSKFRFDSVKGVLRKKLRTGSGTTFIIKKKEET